MSKILKNLSERLNSYTGLKVWSLEKKFDVYYYDMSENVYLSQSTVNFSFYRDGHSGGALPNKLGFLQVPLSIFAEGEDFRMSKCLEGLCQAIQVLCLAEPRLGILIGLLSKHLGRPASFDTVYTVLDTIYRKAQREIEDLKTETDISKLFALLTLFAFDQVSMDEKLFLELCRDNRSLFAGRQNSKIYKNPVSDIEKHRGQRKILFTLPKKYESQNPSESENFENFYSVLDYALEKWAIRFAFLPKQGILGSSKIYEGSEAPISNKIPVIVVTQLLFNNYAERAVVLPIMSADMYKSLGLEKPKPNDPLYVNIPSMYAYRIENTYSGNEVYDGYIDCTQINTVGSAENITRHATVKVLQSEKSGSKTVFKPTDTEKVLPEANKSLIRKGLMEVLGVDKSRPIKKEIDLNNYFISGDRVEDRITVGSDKIEIPMRFCGPGIYRRDYSVFAEGAREFVDISIKKRLFVSETKVSADLYDTILGLYNPRRMSTFGQTSDLPAIVSDFREMFLFLNALSILANLGPVYKIDTSYYKKVVADDVSKWDPYLDFMKIPEGSKIKFEVIRAHVDGYRLLSEAEWEHAALGSLGIEDREYYKTLDFKYNEFVGSTQGSSAVGLINEKNENTIGLKGMYGGGVEFVGTSVMLSYYFTPEAMEENLNLPKSQVPNMATSVAKPEYWSEIPRDDPSFYIYETDTLALKNLPSNVPPEKYSVFRRSVGQIKNLNTTHTATFRICRTFL